ncbi:MAG: NAD(P)/FAD-dependent oxidoreductase [Prevotella sp.]|nr:NAD(P)/FAD-dependent oxidoreductase [Prevotella sp.]
MRYDVVVIGSGFGGLICAQLLSRAGKRVLVVERQSQPGGCLQSYQRDGMAFDTGFHYVGGLGDGQRLHRIFSHLGLMRLPWHRLDADGFDQVTIGHHTYAFAEGYSRFVDTLATSFPDEREALQRYVRMLQQSEQVPFGSSDVYQFYGMNAYHYLKNTFKDPLLINVLSGTSLKMELRRETLPFFTFAHGNSSYIQSSWRLKGSGSLIVRALTDEIRANGGEIVTQTEVEELLERNGRLAAVRCRDGRVYEGLLFISDIHPVQTFEMVRESALLKGIFRRRIHAMENSFGMFTASLVLKPEMLRYFNHNKFVYLKPNVWTFHEDLGGVGGVMVSCRVPEEGDYARQVDLLTPMPWDYCKRWEQTVVNRRGEDYVAMKEMVAGKCIRLAEQVIPGLSGMIEKCYTSTPLTYRDYNRTPNGSAYGVRKDCRNLLMTMLSPRTPIPGLLLTGQNVMLHGLEGVAMTALQTCAEVLGNEYVEKIFKE